MELDFEKMNGLIPAIIQDEHTQKVLMLGFMNKEAYEKTVETGKVTFFSRTKNRLWTKGETSGNFLNVVSIKADCDNEERKVIHPAYADTTEPRINLHVQHFYHPRQRQSRVVHPVDRPIGGYGGHNTPQSGGTRPQTYFFSFH